MGRPRHQPRTADELLDAAERLVETEGVGALSVRRVAEAAGTTTRAVYSLYGSKDGLVTALGARAYELLRIGIEGFPTTDDPAGDLVEAGIAVFRAFAVSHPSLFRVSVQRTLEGPGFAPIDRAEAYEAWVGLEAKVARVDLGGRSVNDAASSFHALCEGLAALELRGQLPAGREEAFWRDTLATLVRGFAAVPADEPASLPSV
jgi:AcrR family transcriptional regulator